MSDTVKLLIELPEKTIAHIRSDYGHGCKAIGYDDKDIIVDAIYNATPLDDLKLKIEQDMCFDMFDDYGNKTAIHKELWEILDNIDKEEKE